MPKNGASGAWDRVLRRRVRVAKNAGVPIAVEPLVTSINLEEEGTPKFPQAQQSASLTNSEETGN